MTVRSKDKGRSPALNAGQTRVLNMFLYTILTATITTLIGILVFYIYSLANMYHGTANGASMWLLGIFSDFVEIMNYSLTDSPYLEGAGSSYPAIAIAVLYPFALICKGVFANYADMGTISVNELTSYVVCHPEFWIALILFFIISMASISLLITRILRLNLKETIKMTLVIIMSAPMVYAIMRGNTIYFALIFTLIFLLLYNSENAVLRELALLSLAVAGCIKIYPLFFGVFLLKDKKILSSIRVAAYFFSLFFLSFFLFSGTGGDSEPFWKNLLGFVKDDLRLGNFRNLSITALLFKLVKLFSPTAVGSDAFSVVNLVILAAIFICATFFAIYTRSGFSRAVICSAIVILIPPVSYFYVLIFILIPFAEFIREYDKLSKHDRVLYSVFFMFLMLTPILLPQIYIPHMLIIGFMMGYEIYKIIRHELKPKLKK